MNDPFAALDPIQKPKTAAERVLTSPSYTNSPPPGAPVAVAPFGAGAPGHMGMGMGMGGGAMDMGGMGSMGGMGGGMPPMGGMGMGGMGGGMPPMGGMGMGMGMGGGMPPMGGMGIGQQAHNPFQPQQQPPQQQPVMYDNIKNLLQQKPKAPAAFEDTASMDFLENLGGGGGGGGGGAKTNSGSFPAANPQVRAAEPTSMPVVADPFGGGAFGGSPAAPAVNAGDLSIFETGGGASNSSGGGSGSTPVSPSTAGGKSSALADRLANGRRKTQEAQRSQLQFNASAFAHPGGAAGPKISLKEMAGQAPSKASEPSGIVSFDDFASGGTSSAAATTGSFGSSDPFGGRGGSFGSTAATSSGGAVRQSSFGNSDEPKPVDENDNTFW